jgi:potassium efflux system protein
MNIFLQGLGRQFIVTVIFMMVTCVAWGAVSSPKAEEAMLHNSAKHAELLILQQKLQDDTDLLEFSQAHLEKLRKNNEIADSSERGYVEPKQVEEAKFNLELAGVQVEKVKLELSSTQTEIPLLEGYISQYEQQLIKARARNSDEFAAVLDERLSLERQKLLYERERVKKLTQLLGIVTEIHTLEQDNLNRATEQLRLEQVASIWKDQQAQEANLLKEQAHWEQKLSQYRQALDKLRPLQSPPTAAQQALLDDIAQAQEHMQLTHIQLTLTRMDTLLRDLSKREAANLASYRQTELSERVARLKAELVGTQIQVENQEMILARQLEMLKQPGARHALSGASKNRLTDMYTDLQTDYHTTDKNIHELMTRIEKLQANLLVGARQTWQTRQQLPRDLEGWSQFAKDLWTLPQLTYQSLVSAYDQMVMNLSNASAIIWLLLLVLMSAWISACIWVRRRLSEFLSSARDLGLSFSANAFIVVAQLVYRNITGITLFGALLILSTLLNVSANNMVALISLGAVWFFYRIATGLARISLFENIWDLSGSDVVLYQGLRWSLGLGSFIIALTVLAHYLPLPQSIVASFDRLFMLVLLGVSIPLLRGWRVLPSIIAKEGKTKSYIRRTTYLLGLFIPLSLFSTAIIGLIGYVNLAWIIWIAEGQFLMVLTAVVLARGLLGDTMEMLAKTLIRNLKSGWVWTESVLKPMHTVLYLLIYFVAGFALFHMYGLDHNPKVMERLTILATKPLIQMGGISITVFNVLQFVILLMVIRWAAKWSREFAYRFIFAKYKDKGLRNSMAVFTQYATIMLGAFVILKVIGIDLTTLTVVLGALAVGIGFGLQSIANNMVSGILLLIERPFRAGDIITLGAHEGEVTHIGVRATTIKTWDNMDVIIPNAETVSQALTNWTHHDSIVRTTLDINIDYSENPYQAQAIIMQVLRRHAAVVSFPDPSVLLTDFAVYSLKFQVRYFIDLSLGKSRAEVRSEVLFAIWDSLRASGIEIPFPHQSVEIVKSS